MNLTSEQIISAIIAGVVSIIIWILSFFFEPIKIKVTRKYQLEIEHKYHEKEKIKNTISHNKMSLLKSAEELNYRFWNLYSNYYKNWHTVNNQIEGINSYYFYSFLYRISCFYTWAYKTEAELEFIDSTFADKKDLEFLKYLRIFQKIICDTQIIIDYDKKYDTNFQRDHLFSNNLIKQCQSLSEIEFQKDDDFKQWVQEHANCFTDYINGINPTENRYRWDILQLIHLLLICFLNSYGYDYQYTSVSQLKELLTANYTNKRLQNSFIKFLKKFKLNNQKEIKKLIRTISSVDTITN